MKWIALMVVGLALAAALIYALAPEKCTTRVEQHIIAPDSTVRECEKQLPWSQ